MCCLKSGPGIVVGRFDHGLRENGAVSLLVKVHLVRLCLHSCLLEFLSDWFLKTR